MLLPVFRNLLSSLSSYLVSLALPPSKCLPDLGAGKSFSPRFDCQGMCVRVYVLWARDFLCSLWHNSLLGLY